MQKKTRALMWIAVAVIASIFMSACCSRRPEPIPTEAPATPTATLAAVDTPQPDEVWERIQSEGKMTVGTSADYPPFEYYDKFELVGFDIALIKEIGDILGIEIVIRDMAFDGLGNAIMVGQIDAAIAALSFTPERAASVDFSSIYFVTKDAVLAKAGAQSAVQNPRDLAGRRVGVQFESVHHEWMSTELVETGLTDASNLILYRDLGSALNDLDGGRIDYFVADLLPAKRAVDAGNFDLAGEGLNVQQYAIALPKGAGQLQKEINRALLTMRTSGRLQELVEEYLDLDETEVEPLPTPMPTGQPTATPVPTSPPAACVDGMEWVADLSYDDDNMRNPPVLQPGQPFRKGWRLRNSGTCTWNAGYSLVYVEGNVAAARMGGQPVVIQDPVRPGETADLYVDLVAPLEPGTYRAFWTMRNSQGSLFGDRVWVGIHVPALATPTPVPTETPSGSVSFSVDRTVIIQGECVTFSWVTRNVREVYFYHEGQDWRNHGVVGEASRQECPGSTLTYYLRVVHTNGSVEVRHIRIDVNPRPADAPVIAQFSVVPEGQIVAGTCVDINWDVQGQASNVRISRNNGDIWNPAPLRGNTRDCPPVGSQAYQIEATGPGGTSRAQRHVNVVQPEAPTPTPTPIPPTPAPQPPVIQAFSVSPSQIEAGGCVQVTWRVGGGVTLVQILRNGAIVVDGGSFEGSVQDCLGDAGTYVYRLQASNDHGQSDAREDTVQVQAAPPQNPLPGTFWQATTYWARGSMQQVIQGTSLTAAFTDDGQVNGSGGCNTYSASYTASGGVISISSLQVTQIMCGEPAGIMQQESAFLSALTSAQRFSMEGGQLYLSNNSNRVMVEFVPALQVSPY